MTIELVAVSPTPAYIEIMLPVIWSSGARGIKLAVDSSGAVTSLSPLKIFPQPGRILASKIILKAPSC